MYTLPTFNLTAGIFRWPATPGAAPPTLTSPANLAWGKRIAATRDAASGVANIINLMLLLLPAMTDVRDNHSADLADQVEVPLGSGRIYAVTYVDDIGKGFANEHRAAYLAKIGDWPAPIT